MIRMAALDCAVIGNLINAHTQYTHTHTHTHTHLSKNCTSRKSVSPLVASDQRFS